MLTGFGGDAYAGRVNRSPLLAEASACSEPPLSFLVFLALTGSCLGQSAFLVSPLFVPVTARMAGLVCDASPGTEEIRARATRLRGNVDDIFFEVARNERAARIAHEQEVPALLDQVSKYAQKIQELQLEKEAAEARVIQLESAYTSAKEQRREVEVILGRARENTVGSGRPLCITSTERLTVPSLRAERRLPCRPYHHGR